jgi:formylglycine-generating enzyme required for sulfatase activity
LYYAYQTDGSTFKLTATPESQKYQTQTQTNANEFIAGSNTSLAGGPLGPYWVLVPGNAQFGTNNFWVMKYDASCENATSGVALTTPTDGNAYKNNSSAFTNCIPINGLAAAPIPGAIPIVDISQASSSAACTAIGASLITNAQWQTIAWNAENVPSNWSLGSVGSGYIYPGHDDSNPAQASVTSANDSQGCVGTDGPASCGGTGSNATQIRTIMLSNGSVIWDMGGNLRQWTSDQITGANEPNAGAGSFAWHQFTAITTWGTMTQQTAGPMNPAWSSTQDIGETYSEGSSTDNTTYGFVRGGFWGDGTAVAGVETLNLSFTPGYTYANNMGFRCAR